MHGHLLTAVVACLSSAAFADLTMVTESVTQGKTRTVTLSAKGNKAFFEMKEGEGQLRTMLRDADAKKMFLIDHPKKTVLVMTEEDSKALEERQAQFREQMKAQLAKMPPEQRKRMEGTMLGGALGGDEVKLPVFSYEKLKSAARKVNGFSCQDYAIKRDGVAYGEGCFMTWKDAGLTADDFKNTMLRAMPTAATVGPMGHAFEQQTNAPGFPVYRKVVDEKGAVTSESTLKTFSKTALEAAKFELPRGYEEKSMSSAMPGMRPPPPGAPAPALGK